MAQVIKIARYDVVDAEFEGDHIRIPEKTNPTLSYQLDGWDRDTAVHASIDGQRLDLQLDHYDDSKASWVLKKPA
ncbi:DUF1480 family protein [Pantoea sp. 1.19]|uniref:DUF1480 family protein n=1 Tax=Pantoea sp. 1.19 TaxID=1925589 RepID=UPI000948BDCB|nr:DUF1480 family protein [Pantoea sp. 1.19]